MNPFWYFSFRNWSHFQIISSFIATRRYLDQVTKKHLQTHKVQYFQPMGLENFQIEWPPKQNLHYLEGVRILLLCKALHMRYCGPVQLFGVYSIDWLSNCFHTLDNEIDSIQWWLFKARSVWNTFHTLNNNMVSLLCVFFDVKIVS